MPDEPLRLKWRHTWPDKPHDFVGQENGKRVGRIHKSFPTDHRKENWLWSMNGTYLNWSGSTSGFSATKNEAAREVEREWFAMKARRGAIHRP